MMATGVASVALIGCQLITGIDDLRVERDASTLASSEGDAAAAADAGGEDAIAAADAGGEDAIAAADAGGEDAQVLGGSDSAGTADSDARDGEFNVAACTPAPVGGHRGTWTRCMLESQVPQSIMNCVDYCASLGSCCATNCIWDPVDSTTNAAEYTSELSANCADPTTFPNDNTATDYLACSNSPLVDPNAYFKCCCGP
jgi:hypothetical protein